MWAAVFSKNCIENRAEELPEVFQYDKGRDVPLETQSSKSQESLIMGYPNSFSP
jgi:hypothetical protein